MNGSITRNETKDKIIFWDIDGTLAPYRFNNQELNSRDFSHEMKTTFIKILYLLFYVFLKIAHNKYE